MEFIYCSTCHADGCGVFEYDDTNKVTVYFKPTDVSLCSNNAIPQRPQLWGRYKLVKARTGLVSGEDGVLLLNINNPNIRCGWVTSADKDEVLQALEEGKEVEGDIEWAKRHRDDENVTVARIRREIV